MCVCICKVGYIAIALSNYINGRALHHYKNPLISASNDL